ncbi:Ger(x)C family spore germination protein [Paenibacillus sp. UNC451MF]|uniref:Ger(x)C family spore germination protein n=1 Tax=Paenibacillus sp. UNC451MF TaxID=1449063 RepID=UPI000490A8AA|nr:Ger(x)C family spore germination protein [Paenibacillus sp. UNC451MF]
MIRKLLVLTVMFCCVALLGGCGGGHKDINKRMLPVIVGINEGKNESYKVIIRIPQPGEKKFRVIEAEAPTISKAFDLMRTKAEVSIDLLHLKLVLFSESIAKQGIKEFTEYAFRSREIPPKILVAVAQGLESIMSDQRPTNVGAAAFDFFSREAGWTPNISIVPLWKAFRSLNSETEDVAIPIISKGKDTLFDFHGSAMMREDRMVAAISMDETLIYNLFEGLFVGGVVEVMEHASVTVVKTTVLNHAEWKDVPRIRSDMKMSVVIQEERGNPSEEDIKKELEKIIRNRFEQLMKKTQVNKSDILGLGQYFTNKMTEQQRNHWKEEWFPKLEHEFTLEINIRNTGNLK